MPYNKIYCAIRFALIIVAVVESSLSFPEQLLVSSSPACSLSSPWLPEYHLDSTCDRALHNSRELRLQRYHGMLELAQRQQQRQNKMVAAPSATTSFERQTTADRTPIELTITCPSSRPYDLRYASNDGSNSMTLLGHPTKWIVENTANTPVVVAMVPLTKATLSSLSMISAANPMIYPPQNDPDSILQPSEWKSFDALEGQVFHVYQLLETFDDDKKEWMLQLGKLLLQHRVGLISIQKSNQQEDPVQRYCTSNPPSPSLPSLAADHPVFPFTTNANERCNMLYRGFRNDVGCDVDVYYVRSQGSNGPCFEVKKFSLGNGDGANDNDPVSSDRTQYQATLVDSTFVVRLAKHPKVIVDTITIQPTRIVECSGHLPRRKEDDSSASSKQSALQKVHMDLLHPSDNNQTTAELQYRWLSLLALPEANETQQPADSFISSASASS